MVGLLASHNSLRSNLRDASKLAVYSGFVIHCYSCFTGKRKIIKGKRRREDKKINKKPPLFHTEQELMNHGAITGQFINCTGHAEHKTMN